MKIVVFIEFEIGIILICDFYIPHLIIPRETTTFIKCTHACKHAHIYLQLYILHAYVQILTMHGRFARTQRILRVAGGTIETYLYQRC